MKKPGIRHLRGIFKREAPRARLDELCEFAPIEGEQEDRVYWLVRMVSWLRPRGGEGGQARLKFLRNVLENHPEWRERMTLALSELVRHSDVRWALAHAGVPRHFHLGGTVRDWAVEHTLPAACRTHEAGKIIGLAFEPGDARWLRTREAVSLIREIIDPALASPLEDALRAALVDLVHQVIAQAHAPAVRSLARDERSPFGGLYEAVAALNATPGDDSAASALQGRIHQCVLAVREHRAELAERGADLNTTFVLTRLSQQLERLRRLAALRHRVTDETLGDALASLVEGVARNLDGKQLVARSADLVVQNLVDTAARVGRDYLDEENSTWRAAFVAGAGGGVLMAVATVIKCLLARAHLPPLYEGLVFSLNYASAFLAAYLLHFTIATKLPAHTAAALARAVQSPGGHRQRLHAFVAVWRTTARLQLAGLVGNVAVVGPLSFLIDVGFVRWLHQHVVSVDKGEHLLHANSALGPSVLYAALTGVFLWVSSLVGAACDNWARTAHLTDRLVTNPRVMGSVGRSRVLPYAEAFTARFGGMVGNATLGFLLGAVPAAFAIASLPVEIRHVTVSTGSVALALAAGAGTRSSILLALGGLLVIAVVNVAVSFALALWLALRATRGMRAAGSSFALLRIGLRWWLVGDRRAGEGAAGAGREATAPATAGIAGPA